MTRLARVGDRVAIVSWYYPRLYGASGVVREVSAVWVVPARYEDSLPIEYVYIALDGAIAKARRVEGRIARVSEWCTSPATSPTAAKARAEARRELAREEEKKTARRRAARFVARSRRGIAHGARDGVQSTTKGKPMRN